MSQAVFRKLRDHLNRLPIGTPTTSSEVEIEILKKLFTPDQAAMALSLTAVPEKVEEIAARIGKPADDIKGRIQEMEQQGLIWWTDEKGIKKYGIMPLYPGILELQVDRMGKDLAGLTERYLENALTQEIVGTEQTRLFRIVPIEKNVPVQMYIHPYEKVASIIEGASEVYLTECLCRRRKGELNKACEAPTDVCLIFDNYGRMMADNGIAQRVSKEEAMETLGRAEDAGLVHNSLNVEKGNQFVCNCCGCCCAVLKSVTQLNTPNAVVRADYRLSIDKEKCTGCGACVKRCHFGAVSVEENESRLDHDRCVGCGVCILTCPAGARFLVRKNPEETTPAFSSDEVAFAALAKERGRTPPLPER